MDHFFRVKLCTKVNTSTASFFFCSLYVGICGRVFSWCLFFSISFSRLIYLIHAFLPHRHQQEVEGQAQSTAASTTAVTSNINTVNAGPYIPVSAPSAVQQFPQPVRAPFMAQQQQQQRPIRPPGPPQLPPGIPSYSSQIEGLSVSQALVNDVLIDLQTKVLNETLEQYQNESSSGAYLGKILCYYSDICKMLYIFRTTSSNFYSSTTTNSNSSIRSSSSSC